jgi:hypothetical protein
MRIALFALAAVVVGATPVAAQPWADKMFQDGTSHDFGSVPHGAQLFHRFTITNIYAVPLQILDVRSSCTCTTPTPSSRLLQPRESATIDVTMDARRFTGSKTVRINVTVGPEFTSTAELKVTANSRADVVFNPGEVNFGVVPVGQGPTQTIDVEYAGSHPWKVESINTNGAPYSATLEEWYRKPGQVGYHLRFTLNKDAPAGVLKHEVLLQTNDPSSPAVPLLVEATVQASLSVSPETVALGSVAVGQAATHKVLVRGSRPFRILGIDDLGDDVSITTTLPTHAATVNVVEIKCQMSKPGDLRRQLKIKTDLQPAPVTVTVEMTATP